MPDPTDTYVYGVVRADPEPQLADEGVAGMSPRAIAHGGVAAVVSDVAAEPIAPRRADLLAHVRVLQEAMAVSPVLPMRFGVVMPDDDAVVGQLLEANADRLRERLDELEGYVELTVRGLYRDDAGLREIVAEHEEIRALREQVRGTPEAATYAERIRLGELVSEAIAAKRAVDAERIVAELEPLARDVRVNEGSHEQLAVSAAFLVREQDVERFDDAVRQVEAREGERIDFTYTGPLPPHSFVDLALETPVG